MRGRTPGLSRRRLLAAIALSSLGESVVGAGRGDSAGSGLHDVPATSRRVSLEAYVSRNGQQTVAVPLILDLARTVVIVCDMQNDFGSRGGMFDRAGIDISMIQRAIGPTAKALASARRSGLKIVYLKMGFLPDLSNLGEPDSVNRVRHVQGFKVGQTVRTPDGRDSRILIRDNWGTDIVPELLPAAGDTVIHKHRFSGFFETELDTTLKSLRAKHLIFTGCTTSVCVESTIRDAMFRDYLPVLLADCTAEPIGSSFPRSNHDASLLAIETLLGWVSASEKFIAALDEEETRSDLSRT